MPSRTNSIIEVEFPLFSREQHLHVLGNANLNDNYDPEFTLQPDTTGLPLGLLLPVANLKYNLFVRPIYEYPNRSL